MDRNATIFIPQLYINPADALSRLNPGFPRLAPSVPAPPGFPQTLRSLPYLEPTLWLARKNHRFYEATRLLRARLLLNGRFAPV
jgi:hypothetical protein